MKKTSFLIILLFTACRAASTETTPTPLHIQYTLAARTWLAGLYDCAAQQDVVIQAEPRAADYFDPTADLALRLGQPAIMTYPAYQIDSEQIAVIVNPENQLAALSFENVRALFSGHIKNWNEINSTDLPVQVWIYATGEDLEQIFEAEVLQGALPTSTARLATSPEAMAAGIASDPGALGFLPHSQVTQDVQIAWSGADVPVLAISPSEPLDAVSKILLCLQK